MFLIFLRSFLMLLLVFFLFFELVISSATFLPGSVVLAHLIILDDIKSHISSLLSASNLDVFVLFLFFLLSNFSLSELSSFALYSSQFSSVALSRSNIYFFPFNLLSQAEVLTFFFIPVIIFTFTIA